MRLDSSLISGLVNILKKYSPTIALAVGGPYGGLIASLLCNIFGLDPKNATPDQLATSIQNDSDSSLKLTEFQYEHEDVLQKIWSDNYKLEIQDRENARQENNDSKYGWVVHVLSAVIVIGFIICLMSIMYTKSEPDDQHILTMMFGILGATFGQVIAYYYGSIRRLSNAK